MNINLKLTDDGDSSLYIEKFTITRGRSNVGDVWVPTKAQIEGMLTDAALRLRRAKTVSEVQDWLLDQLAHLECHVANRASDEQILFPTQERKESQ